MKKAGLTLLALGLLAFLGAGYYLKTEMEFLSHAESVTGVVADYSVSPGTADESDTYCPIIELTGSNGMKVSYESEFCASSPSYDMGEQVDMYYDPSTNRAQMKGFFSQYLGVIILTALSLPLFLGGLGAIFRKKG